MTSEPSEPSKPSPTIADVLTAFLAEQERRLAPRTYARYVDVVQLLRHYLDGYGANDLSAAERTRLQPGGKDRDFCDVFGPDRILAGTDEFLGWFMIRKVMAGNDLMRAAGSVMKKLAQWLAAQEYVEIAEAVDAAARGATAARELPRASKLADALRQLADAREVDARDVIEDHFRIVRNERGSIWVEPLTHPGTRGPIALPAFIAAECREGWTISGAIGRAGKRWMFVEVWNVYP